MYKKYIAAMKDFRDLIDRWPTRVLFAEEVGVPYERACRWYNSNSIPHGYANDVVKAAVRQNIAAVTLELLAELAENRKSLKDKETEAA